MRPNDAGVCKQCQTPLERTMVTWCVAEAPCLVKYRDGASTCPSATILAFSSSRCFSVCAREPGFVSSQQATSGAAGACEGKNSDSHRAYQLLDWKQQHHCKYRLRNHLQSPFFSAEHVHKGELVRRESQRREVLQAQQKREPGNSYTHNSATIFILDS